MPHFHDSRKQQTHNDLIAGGAIPDFLTAR